MTVTASTIEDLTIDITQEIDVNAPVEKTFAALLEEIGPQNVTQDGSPMPMILEPRPGGRWYRDLGDDNGHLWGHVQAIRRPTLLEINGPLFMSYPVISNVQYRLTPHGQGTRITFHHKAMGLVPDDHRTGLTAGWHHILERVRETAQRDASV